MFGGNALEARGGCGGAAGAVETGALKRPAAAGGAEP